jgi:hypothetical protein
MMKLVQATTLDCGPVLPLTLTARGADDNAELGI